MKKISWLLFPVFLLIIPGCLDTVDETTINENGSGTFVHKDELGKLFSMLTAFAGDDKMKELEQIKKDTTIYLKDVKDSVKHLNSAEIKLLESGVLKVNIDAEKELFSFTFSFPFSKPGDISSINDLLKKTKNQIMDGSMKNAMAQNKGADQKGLFDKELSDGDMEVANSSVNDYYITYYQNGKLSRKVNKDKLARLDNDKGMTSLKEMSGMGVNPSMKTIIKLPKPVKKTEGKGIKLSDDKKTITIEATMDDFFEDASLLEYVIEY
jgi:hypothetical protein